MSGNTTILSKANLAVFLALCMVAGFLCSRVVLSISMILFGINALRGAPPSTWLKQRWWLLGLLWIAGYVISWFWSENVNYWQDRVQTKLPFLLLPLSFSLLPAFTTRQLKQYTIGLCVLMILGIGYSLSFLVIDPQRYIEGYIQSHVLPTPAIGDHIRFSMAVALSTAWCLYMLPQLRERLIRAFIVISILIFSVYLHILAAKTGLVAFYILMLAWAFYQASRKNRLLGATTICLIILSGILAIKFIPTLNYRFGYTLYSYQQYISGNISGDYSDVGRVISYKLGLQLIQDHPVTGVGVGDIWSEMNRLYEQDYPHIPPTQRLIPHNQFLTTAVGAGIVNLILFLWWFIAPLTKIKRNRAGFYFFTTWLMLLFFLMTDASLEVQFGVFVFLYFLLWQWHALRSPKNA